MKTMTTFRSNWNSVSKTYNLTALRKRLTTCFQKWHHKCIQQLNTTKLTQKDTNPNFSQFFIQHEYCSIFSEKTNNNFKELNTKIKKIFQLQKSSKSLFSKKQKVQRVQEINNNNNNNNNNRGGETVHIFAKLLSSSTLITTTTTGANIASGEQQQQCIFYANKTMTILDNTYLSVRDENPDIDNEVRAILMTHAQKGVTISEIKDDYRNMTGQAFPIYGNIADFLLTIPRVTAECNEKGTLIFNIKPSTNSKHMHDLIVNQKCACNSKTGTYYNDRANSINSRRQPHRTRPSELLKQSHLTRPLIDDINNNNENNNNNIQRNQKPNLFNKNNQNTDVTLAAQKQKTLDQQLPKNQAKENDFDEFIERSWCYHDNCNYLNIRFNGDSHIYNDAKSQPNQQPPLQYKQQYSQPAKQRRQIVIKTHNLNANNKNARRLPTAPHPVLCSSPTLLDVTNVTQSNNSINSDYSAHILDFPLLGDDFFLYMARMELKCKFNNPGKILQSGLCVSGQTINAAVRRIRNLDLANNCKIIVNIGSVDIMNGRPLIQIEHDFRQLINLMRNKFLQPILTTLAPLANYSHDPAIKDKLLRFNEFIKREGQYLTVIDIHSCLVNERGTLRFDCYQDEPRTVTGSSKPHVFWNKIGRQRVLQMIEANLEY